MRLNIFFKKQTFRTLFFLLTLWLIFSILINEVIPVADEFQNECKRIWEKMFGGIAKNLIRAGSIAGLSNFFISFFTGSWIDLIVKGCGLATPIVLSHVIDYALEKRNLKRKNAFSYLIDFR